MTKSIACYCLIVLFFFSCKTVSVDNKTQKITKQQMSLGSIGTEKKLLLEKRYTNAAIPAYTKPIKVSISLLPFTKKKFQAFDKARVNSSTSFKIKYVDSIKNKPRFASLYIADKVTLLEALNAQNNRGVKEYLSTKNKASIITNIAIAFDEATISKIMVADEILLEAHGVKSYALQLYKNGHKTEPVLFNEGVVFAYSTSYCCWKENDKSQLEIADIVPPSNRCPNITSTRASRAKKDVNHFKL